MKKYKSYINESISDRFEIKNKIDKLFKKYDFDYMFVGWSSWRRDRNITIDEIGRLNNKTDYLINGSENNKRFYNNIEKLSLDVIDELSQWYDEITSDITYLFESTRFNIDNLICVLKVEKENMKNINKGIITEMFDDFIDSEYEKDLEKKDFQDLLITDNFIFPFFQIAYDNNLKNYLKDKYPDKYQKFLKQEKAKEFNL